MTPADASSVDWSLDERDGLLVARCRPLERATAIRHAFSTRRADGRSDFDLGGAGSAGEGVRARRRRFLAAAGLAGVDPVVLRQVHGDRVARCCDVPDGAEADAAVWIEGDPGARCPAVRTADCVPVLLVDRRGRGAAAVHAGWRGTAAGVAARAVEALEALGIPARELLAALGPAIGGCCYEVEAAVAERVAAACGSGGRPWEPSGREGRVRLDLHAANRAQLEAAGLEPGSIHAAPWCTRCRAELFFSHRAEGPGCGRAMAIVGGRPAPRARRSP